MRASFFAVLVAVFLAGCGIKQEVVEITRYVIGFETRQILDAPIANSIYIETPNVNRSFNQSGIFYSKKSYVFEEYAKNRWINTPSVMIFNQIADSVLASNIFKTVIVKDRSLASDYQLQSEIVKLYHLYEDGKSYAVLKANFLLIRGGEVVKSYTTDQRFATKSDTPYGFVIAINEALKNSIESVLEDIRGAIDE